MRGAKALLEKHNALLIADEVHTQTHTHTSTHTHRRVVADSRRAARADRGEAGPHTGTRQGSIVVCVCVCVCVCV